jgi:hypothetical protein
MTIIRWFLGVAVAAALVFLGGILHGYYSNRWGVPLNVQKIGEELSMAPLEFGDWTAEGDKELTEAVASLLECKGSLNRVYFNRKTGAVVSVAILFGPKGPIAVHTPEICYSSRDVRATGGRKAVANQFDGLTNQLWSLMFESNNIEKSKLSVRYAWSDGGEWVAAEAPRFWRTDYLYKLQTAAQLGSNGKDPTDDFLRDFLPELRKHLTLRDS